MIFSKGADVFFSKRRYNSICGCKITNSNIYAIVKFDCSLGKLVELEKI